MKILYIANERSAAHLAATALRSISPDFKLLWASSFERAALCILDFSDVAALIVEVRSDSAGCLYLKRARELGLKAPVVVVLPDGAGSPAESLKAGVDSYLAKNRSFPRELPVVVTRAIERAQTSAHVVRGDQRPSETVGESAAGVPADRQSQPGVGKAQQPLNVPAVAHSPYQSKVEFVSAPASKSMLERRISELETMFHQREQSWVAEQAAGAERQETLEKFLHQERSMRAGFEQELADAKAAFEDAEHRHSAAITAATAALAERHMQYEVGMTRVASTWDTVDEQLRQWGLEVERARQTLASSAVTEVARLTEREAALTSQLAEAAATRRSLEAQLADARMALTEADERATRDRLAAGQQAAERKAELEGLIRQDRATRADVEQQLAQVEAARREAERQHASAMTTATTALVERQAQFEVELAQTAAARDDFQRQVNAVETALAEARQDHAAVASEIERLTQREAELTSQLAEAAATRRSLEAQLADARTALTEADERATRDFVEAAQLAADRDAEFEESIRQERATRTDVEQQLAQLEAARREADLRHLSAMTTAATTLAERQAQFEVELSQTAAARDDFKRQVHVAETTLAVARRDHATAATEVERLAQREAELTSELAEAATTRRSLEGQLADAATAMKAADERATQERVTAKRHQADVESRLAQEITNREALEREVGEVRSAAADAEQRFLAETATLTARARTEVAQLEGQIAQEREDHKDRLLAEQDDAQHHLEEARRDFQQTLDRVSGEHADALVKLTAAVAEGDAQIKEQAAQHASSLQAAERDRSQLQHDFQATLVARGREIERLQGSLNVTTQELAAARRRCEILQTEADRVTPLERQLDESRAEIRRQFQQSPLALWRCTGDGTLTHANEALRDLIGCRNPDELHPADFAKRVFESPRDLAWLIERCSATKRRQSVETAWKRQDGNRFAVRLSAVESAPDVIEIAVEDITNLRVLEHRLDRAQCIEAVGRVAPEIAVTCSKLLRDVHNDGQQFLRAVSGVAPPLRQRGEMLLDDVARAAGYLQRLAAFGDEQASALEPVDLSRVLRDLKPVLKQVAGDDVELAIPEISSPVNVDVKADRVERLFVNLASFGRERMPSGGKLRIEFGTVVVDQKFIADHPNVRQGPHALITVTEAKRAMLAEARLQIRNGADESTPDRVASEKPGVDLGALQELIQECGGHLWMTVAPPGNMVVEIRLPLRGWDDPAHQPTLDPPSSHGGVMARWFRH